MSCPKCGSDSIVELEYFDLMGTITQYGCHDCNHGWK